MWIEDILDLVGDWQDEGDEDDDPCEDLCRNGI